MTKSLLIPTTPRVRVAYMAPDGGSCSTEYVFASARVMELATAFNRLTADEQTAFGTPSDDEVKTGVALWIRFVAYCAANGVEVTEDGTCIHYTRPAHPDVIRSLTYNDGFPILSIELESELLKRAA